MSNPEKGSSVVLDACVLVPIALCDAFLRLAEEPSLYRPLWSEEILTELRRALVKKPLQLPPCKADYRIACMKAAFPEALVAGRQSLIPTVRIPAAHDKHVVATAIHAGAGAICTANPPALSAPGDRSPWSRGPHAGRVSAAGAPAELRLGDG